MINLFSTKHTGRIFIGRTNTNEEKMVNIRIDRGYSPLANKSRLQAECCRDKVCDDYDQWLNDAFSVTHCQVYEEIMRIVALLESGADVNLQCWCSPKRCHGESIKKLIYTILKERRKT